MLKHLKRAALRAAQSAGVFRLAAGSGWRRRRLLILCYHGISIDDEHEWNSSIFITPSRFEARLRLLRDARCAVLPLAQALDGLHAGELPDRAVAITFDDGFFDFFCQACPLLRRYELPATVYLTTYYCDYNRPVFDVACSYLLWKGRGAVVETDGLLGPRRRLDLTTGQGRASATSAVKDFARQNRLSAEEKDQLAERLAGRLGVDYQRLLGERILHLMTPQEVARLAEAGVDVQLHTHRHRTPLDRALFHREIQDNRRRILEMTGARADHFCYPSGFHRPEFLPWLAEQNVTSATTCQPGLATPSSHRLLLPRLVDHSQLSQVEFEGWLAGVAAVLPRRTPAAASAA